MNAGPVRLPPRHSLPRDVVVPVLPGLGFTWYDRGGGYWARRVGLFGMWAIVTALITLITVGILAAAQHHSPAAFAVLLTIEVVYSLGILAFFAVQTARRWNDPDAGGQLLRRPDAASKGGAGPGPGHLLGQLFLAFSFLFTGLYLALLLTSLLPETLPERQARLRIAGELRGRGHIVPEP